MPNKMLIDATHPEETRVVVVRGNRVEEFDFESANRKQLRGNIYLAKVTRVEPSLQAAFIEYGGNRHGFLAFSEIHPDYYQIPVADRQALIEADEQAHREAEEESESRPSRRRSRHRSARRRSHGERVQSQIVEGDNGAAADPESHGEADNGHDDAAATDMNAVAGQHDDGPDAATVFAPDDTAPLPGNALADDALADDALTDDALTDDALTDDAQPAEHGIAASEAPAEPAVPPDAADDAATVSADDDADVPAVASHDSEEPYGDDNGHDDADGDDNGDNGEAGVSEAGHSANGDDDDDDDHDNDDHDDDNGHDDHVESVGGDDVLEEVPERAFRPRRQYKIQEVIKRRQVMLVQVVKEERGNKGAALTTYLSLAGRYAVLMPNTARGGGISRKITSSQDRSRLKEVVQDLDVPEGMGVILRTAGAARTKPEIKRDFEYLLRMWETVRDTTLNSQAPTLVYEEGSLIKRSLRDLYNKDIDDIIVAGEAGYREARDFMKMLMPSSVRAVKAYHDAQPLFSRMGVESQLDAMFSPTVQLRSGGYLVINQTEALVSIDVNSGRSTREHHIEDTALKTNLEAAEEVARQLRLRDLAGLVVIDFIDMDEKRNNRAVERKIADCLKQDRARIQIGRISHFGLLEMSRQRIRASMLESSTESCPHCGGSGRIRSVGSVALQLLRGLEEVLMKGATHNLVVRTRTDVALYVLNHKRGHLRDLETAFQVAISVMADASVGGQQSFAIDRGDQVHTLEAAKALLAARSAGPVVAVSEAGDEMADAEHDETATGTDADAHAAEHDEGGEDEGG
ncbi:MAG: Rne/Rng family ribonuclease, partial [Xanthobacteraceae bacterium]